MISLLLAVQHSLPELIATHVALCSLDHVLEVLMHPPQLLLHHCHIQHHLVPRAREKDFLSTLPMYSALQLLSNTGCANTS